jgi:hypothetical protein
VAPSYLTTWEAEIRRLLVQAQPGKIVCKTPSPKITRAKWIEGVAQKKKNKLKIE